MGICHVGSKGIQKSQHHVLSRISPQVASEDKLIHGFSPSNCGARRNSIKGRPYAIWLKYLKL